MANFRYVIDSTFQPFTFQEMLAPYVVYKEAADKAEEHYIDLANKAGKFKALAEYLPEGSKARALYEGYANDLETQAADFGRNGLTMMNKAALTDLRSRYAGEIGQLDTAQAKLDEVMKARNALAASGKPMLYSNATPTIDDFLEGKTFNNYAISQDDLYAKGAAAGKAASSRIYTINGNNRTLGGFYRDFMTSRGWKPEAGQSFRDMMMNNPEMLRAARDTMMERGVYQNLKGADQAAALQSFVNGFIDAAIYEEQHNPQRDYGVPTWSEERNYKLSLADQKMKEEEHQWKREDRALERALKYEFDDKGNVKLKPGWKVDAKGNVVKDTSKSKSGSSTDRITMNKAGKRISWKGNDPADGEKTFRDYEVSDIDKDDLEHIGEGKDYDDLPEYAQRMVNKIIGPRGNYDNYEYYFRPFENGWLWGALNDTEASLEIIPRDIKVDNGDEEDEEESGFGDH